MNGTKPVRGRPVHETLVVDSSAGPLSWCGVHPDVWVRQGSRCPACDERALRLKAEAAYEAKCRDCKKSRRIS